MLQKLKDLYLKLSTEGVKVLFIYDGSTKQPSITLTFAYVAGLMTMLSLVALHLKDTLLTATSMTMLFWAIAVVFYRLRKLDKVKFDLDDKSIELEGNDDNENKEGNKNETTPETKSQP